MRKGEVVGGAIGLLVLAVLALGHVAGSKNEQANTSDTPVGQNQAVVLDQPADRSDLSQQSQLRTVGDNASALNDLQPTQPVADSSVAPSDPRMTSANNSTSTGQNISSQQSGGAAGSIDSAFPFVARVIDSRGKVVVQGGPSLFYKNVEVLPSGATVEAATKSGKWVSVKLQDGNVGYVRGRQLQFQ